MKNKAMFFLPVITLATISFNDSVMAYETVKPDSSVVNNSELTDMAQIPMSPRGSEKVKGYKMELMEKLNLTIEQQQKMQSIRRKYQPQMDSLRLEMRTEKEKLRQMMTNNDSSDNLRQQHQKVASLNQKMSDLRFQIMLEMREVLTPEQRQQWSNMMTEKRANWQGGRGRKKN